MTGRTFQFDFNDLGITVSGIEEIIGFGEGSREFVSHFAEEILREAEEIAEVRAEYRIFEGIVADDSKKTISVGSQSFNVDKIVYSQLKKSESTALFLCTAGPEIGRRSRMAMQERDLLTGYIYDVIGSEVAEAAADLMQKDLEANAGTDGFRITNRYSPGYCGWDVAEQHKLFSFFPDNFCGITLTESALMTPVKSVSGIIGIGKNVKHNPYTCGMCDMKDCIYRRIRGKNKGKKE